MPRLRVDHGPHGSNTLESGTELPQRFHLCLCAWLSLCQHGCQLHSMAGPAISMPGVTSAAPLEHFFCLYSCEFTFLIRCLRPVRYHSLPLRTPNRMLHGFRQQRNLVEPSSQQALSTWRSFQR